MPHTSGELMTAVCGFMQRQPTDFVRQFTAPLNITDPIGGALTDPSGNSLQIGWPTYVDCLLNAVNNARLFAERLIDFELSKTQVMFPNVVILNGFSMTDAVDFNTQTTPIKIKKLITPYIQVGVQNPIMMPVALWSKKRWTTRLEKRYEFVRPVDIADKPIDFTGLVTAHRCSVPFVLIQDGTSLFIDPADPESFASSTMNIAADVVQWLPPYKDGTEEDFLLDNCFDWLMYRTIQELNYFLKEDQRVTLSTGLIETAWNAVLKWNAELQLNTVDDAATLD